MKHTFVLDANVLMRHLKGDDRARDLWAAILKNCHKIALSQPLWDQYMDRWRREKKRFSGDPKLVWGLLTHQEKAPWPPVREDDPNLARVRHYKDWFLPGLVAASGGQLVSTDTSTRRDLGGLTLERALKLAKETNGGQA